MAGRLQGWCMATRANVQGCSVSESSKRLPLGALHYASRVHKNHTVGIHGRVIDIPKRLNATYAGEGLSPSIQGVTFPLSSDNARLRC